MNSRRQHLKSVLAATGLIGSSSLVSSAWAQGVQATAVFPQAGKPIRLLVGLAAGGSLDTQARALAKRITDMSGVQILVENKPGASMMLSAQEVLKSPADGYTLLYAPSSLFAQNPHTLLNIPYDPFKDFTPITMATRGPLVLTAHASLPVNNVKDLVVWGKANPGKLNFASFGTGTSSHVYAEAFAKAAGIEMVHVPYKGTADAVRDLFEGRVQAYFDAAPTAITNAKTGRIKLLGVAAPKRSPAMPDVPTISEQGIAGIDLTSWIAIVGPANMPPALVTQVNALFTRALASAELKEFLARTAYEASPGTPSELTTDMKSAYERWGAMIKQIGFQKQ
jgi:tripartite-type tricarboxylate transporter receptor subunit TctC